MSTINFNDAIFAREALKAFTARIAPLGIFAHDFSGETSKVGNAVYVPRVSSLTATTFAYANNSSFPYENSDGTIGVITVNLDKQHIVGADITDVQAANSSAVDKIAANAGRDLGKRVLQTIWSIITDGSFGAAVVTTASANFDRVEVRQFRLALAGDNAPLDDGWSVVVNETAYDGLLSDSNLSQAFQYGGPEAIREGKIPKVFGGKIFSSNLIPTNSISLTAFACVPDAIAVAMRYLQPQNPGAYDSVMRIVDPESGFVMGYRRHYNPGRGKLYVNLECLFGFAAGLTLGLKIATTATT